MSGQNYWQRMLRETVGVEEGLLLELVRRERSRQPILDGRKQALQPLPVPRVVGERAEPHPVRRAA